MIDVATGAMSLEETDFRLPEPSGFNLTRHYSTATPARSREIFGQGWSCEYEVGLRQDLEGWTFITASGRRVTFDTANKRPGSDFVIDNVSAFHELRLQGKWLVVTQWDSGGASVRYWFESAHDQDELAVVAIESAQGMSRVLERDSAGRLARVAESNSKRTLDWKYDLQGRLILVRLQLDGIQRPLASYEYDEQGCLVKAFNVAGDASTYSYDRAGRLMVASPRGKPRLEFEYDRRGRCVYPSSPGDYDCQRLTYMPELHKTVVQDSRGSKWSYEWRDDGQIERMVTPLGRVETNRYDHSGRVVSQIDGQNQEVRISYDERGNRSRVEYPDGTYDAFEFNERRLIAGHEDRSRARWFWEYDDSGRLTAEVDPLGHRSEYQYDSHGRLVSSADPLKRVTSFRYDRHHDVVEITQPNGGVVRLMRDLAGYVTERVDEVGLVTRIERDALGFPTSLTLPDETTIRYRFDSSGNLCEVVMPDGGRSVYKYDSCCRLVRVDQPDGSSIKLRWGTIPRQLMTITNEAGERHEFRYDLDGDLERETDFRGFQTRFERDRRGCVVRTVAENGRSTVFDHDPNGNVIRMKFQDGNVRSFAYDGLGRLLHAANANSEVVLTRDPLGRIVREQQRDFAVETVYDVAGQRLSSSTSDGNTIAYSYDLAGNLTRLDVHDSQRSKATWACRFERDLAGQLVLQTTPSGIETRWSYFSSGLIDTRKVQKGPATLQSVAYRWQRFDQISTLLDSTLGETTYDYDMRGYPMRALTQGRTSQFRIADERGSVFATLEGSDRLYGPGGVLQEAKGWKYKHNVRGELTEKTRDNDEHWSYEWNDAEELVKVMGPDGRTIEYSYDALGRRVDKRSNGIVTQYRWDAGQLINEHLDGREDVRWIFKPDTYTPLARIQGDRRHAVLTDHLGTPTALYDGGGQLAWRMHLDLYGTATIEGEAQLCPWRWPGQFADAETGLYYNGYRYYDPERGEYISPDALGLTAGLNQWAYVVNVLQQTDPLGLMPGLWDIHSPSQPDIMTKGLHFYAPGQVELGIRPAGETVTFVQLFSGDDPTRVARAITAANERFATNPAWRAEIGDQAGKAKTTLAGMFDSNPRLRESIRRTGRDVRRIRRICQGGGG